MAELTIAPVSRLVRNAGAEGVSESAIRSHNQVHLSDSFAYPVTFPFEWRHSDSLIAKIEKLSEGEISELIEKNNGSSKHKPICVLCGEHNGLEYRKESGNVSHLICEDCAIRYVRKVSELQNR